MGMLNGSGENHEGHTNLDLEKSRISMSPKMAWSIIAAALAVGGALALTQYRMGAVEAEVVGIKTEMKEGFADLKSEIIESREVAQSKQQAYIDCLETERTNKGWTCPLAPKVAAKEPEPKKIAKAATKRASKTEDAGFTITWPWSPAQAKGSK
jgi:hypothetical protein